MTPDELVVFLVDIPLGLSFYRLIYQL